MTQKEPIIDNLKLLFKKKFPQERDKKCKYQTI